MGDQNSRLALPLEVYGFDDEPKCWTDCVHIFIHDPFHNGRLPCIV